MLLIMRPKPSNIKLQKVLSILCIIILIIALVLVIYYIKSDNFKNTDNEDFSVDLLEINSNFYDLTPAVSSVMKDLPFLLNGSRICIYNDNGEMECITAGELSNALNLPNYRKERICIDEECLGYKDLEILTGSADNKFKLAQQNYNKGPNTVHDNCLSKKNINFISCSEVSTPFPNGVDTLGLKNCDDDSINYFTIHDTEQDSSDVAEEVDNYTAQQAGIVLNDVEAYH